MKAEDLKNSILQLAMEGKLVPQNPNDEPASVLLEKIRDEKESLIKAKKIKRNNKESFIFRKNGHFYEKIGKNGNPICIDGKIPFEVPDSWELCRLENLCSLLNPKIGENGEYPYLNAKFLRNKIDPEIKEKGRFIETNTKVILVDGENSGEVFLTHEDGYMGSTFRLLYINSYISDKYLLKLIELWKNPLKKSKKGAAIPHLNKDIFNNIFVGIPPFNEQKRIVNQINSLMPLINKYGDYKEQLDKLNSEFPDKLKSSILQEAIQGKLVPQDSNDEPASVLLERIRDEKERLIKEKKIKRNKNESFIFKKNNHFYEMIGKKGEPICIDDELFNIPDNWEWCTLENILSVHGGKRVPKGYKLLDNPTPYIYIRVTNMKNGSIEKSNLKYLDEHIHEQIKKYTISKDDLYITVAGTIGKVGSVPEFFDGMNLTENANKLTNIFIDKDFLKYILSSSYIQNQLIDKTTKVAQPKLAIKRILSTKIAVPPLNEQKRIVNKLEFIFNELKV